MCWEHKKSLNWIKERRILCWMSVISAYFLAEKQNMSKFNLLLYQKRVMMIIASDNLQILGILFLWWQEKLVKNRKNMCYIKCIGSWQFFLGPVSSCWFSFPAFGARQWAKLHHLEKNQKFEITELYYNEYKYKCLTLAWNNFST